MAGLPCEVPPAYVYESNVHIGNILTILNEQRKSGLLCDISIIVQETEFKAHKAILASCSTYFNKIITDPANVSHNIVLELSSISKAGIESLLEFAYTAKLTVSLTNIDDVICAARELEFKNIEFSCLGYLKQQLLAGKSGSCCLKAYEASSVCGNSTISRPGDQEKQSKVAECLEKKPFGTAEKFVPPLTKNDCSFRSFFGSKRKPSENCKGPKHNDGASVKPELCEQMSQEQHQDMIKKILEQHGLEPASTDERAIEVGATETTRGFLTRYGVGECGERKVQGYPSPSYNSDTDETGSADGESDASSCLARPCGKLRKQPAIKLPFTMDEITSMPRLELHDMLTKNPNLTQEQICAIHEIRRRGKNRIAAQRCRKRKMECIKSLVTEIETLRSEHTQLMEDRRAARDQAIKLSDKFRAKCEKFFKCDRRMSGKKKSLGCNASAAAAPTSAAVDQPQAFTADEVAAHNFQEQAERAHQLCERLKEAPSEDLPPCALLSSCASFSDGGAWGKCSSPDSEDIVCTIVDDGCPVDSPSSTYVMSPSQGLGCDFGNIHISSPASVAESAPPLTGQVNRGSVLQHTRSVEPRRPTLPPFSTLATVGPPVALVCHPGDALMTDLSLVSQSEE